MKKVIVVGAGLAGLSAAWTLRKHGIETVLLEATEKAGGRIAGEDFEGFRIDSGADFFCDSYDYTFNVCEELGLSLIRSHMNLGWFRDGKWILSTPINSFGNAIRIWEWFWKVGILSPGFLKLVWSLRREQNYHNFSSQSRIADVDRDTEEENFDNFLTELGISDNLRMNITGMLEMTMGHIELSNRHYMMSYIAEMLLKPGKLFVPKKGAGELGNALANVCGDSIRLSTPVRTIVIQNGIATGVITDGGLLEADAVICAVPGTKVSNLIPDLPATIHSALTKVTYSSGCRVVIGLDRPPLPSGWHGALYPEDETPLLLDRSINLPDCVPEGKSTLDLLVGRDAAKELFPLDDEEIKHRLLAAARRNPPPGPKLPKDSEGIFTRIYRWEEAVCMGPPGMFKAMSETREQLKQVIRNLQLVGDYMRVPSVNGALTSGIESANEVVELLAS